MEGHDFNLDSNTDSMKVSAPPGHDQLEQPWLEQTQPNVQQGQTNPYIQPPGEQGVTNTYIQQPGQQGVTNPYTQQSRQQGVTNPYTQLPGQQGQTNPYTQFPGQQGVTNPYTQLPGQQGQTNPYTQKPVLCQPQQYPPVQLGYDQLQQPQQHYLAQPGMVVVQPSRVPMPPTNIVLAVLSCFLCCPVTGLIAIFYSLKVSEYANVGNIEAAWDASRNAKKCAIVGLVIGGAVYVCLVLFYVVMIITAASMY